MGKKPLGVHYKVWNCIRKEDRQQSTKLTRELAKSPYCWSQQDDVHASMSDWKPEPEQAQALLASALKLYC